MRILQRPINDGGIKFPNAVTYCDLFYISNLFQYFKTLEKNPLFKTETNLIEFEIGLTLSKMYNLPKLNYIPHRDHPTPYYHKTIQIFKLYKITLQELTKGKIRQIYYRLSYFDKRPFRVETFRWILVASRILPKYLKTFNYRTVRNLLPFSPEPGECALCLQFQDTAVHVMAKCSITRQIWINLREVFNVITQTTFPLDNLTPLNFHIPTQFENFTETIALLLTATNYCIWQMRLGRLNTDLLNSKPVNHKVVPAIIFNHISIREKKKKKRNDSIFVGIINTIKHAIARLLQNLIQME